MFLRQKKCHVTRMLYTNTPDKHGLHNMTVDKDLLKPSDTPDI